jgi:transcriptional regulator of acetoin/glycerol metabolism
LPLLIESHLQRIAPGSRGIVEPSAMKRLECYAFPGNIRELKNILERARLLSDDGVIREKDLPADLLDEISAHPLTMKNGKELHAMAHMLNTFTGSRSELAKALGVSERTLYRRLKSLGHNV